MRIQYEDAKSTLEKVLKDKDKEILDLKGKIAELVSEKPVNMDLKKRFEDDYNIVNMDFG